MLKDIAYVVLSGGNLEKEFHSNDECIFSSLEDFNVRLTFLIVEHDCRPAKRPAVRADDRRMSKCST